LLLFGYRYHYISFTIARCANAQHFCSKNAGSWPATCVRRSPDNYVNWHHLPANRIAPYEP
jgi:hypothetical protein